MWSYFCLTYITLHSNNTLGKTERLKSRKLIDSIFQNGKSFNAFPFRVYYTKTTLPPGTILQAGVSASKKYFKKAVDRNRIKRLTREAYRLKKGILQQTLKENEAQLAVFFIYTGKILPTYQEVSEKMDIILNKLTEQFVQRS